MANPSRAMVPAAWIIAVGVRLLVAYLPTTVGSGSSSLRTEPRLAGDAMAVVSPGTFSTFESDVLAGGVVDFSASCTMVFTSPITIPSTGSVSFESRGFLITLDGRDTTQLFVADGGHLGISNITLYQGAATGVSPSPGSSGSTGTTGSAESSGATDSAGATGGAGGPGTSGGAGGAGGNASGGAIYSTVPPTSQTNVTFTSDTVAGGAGGVDKRAGQLACPGNPAGGGQGGDGGLPGLHGKGPNHPADGKAGKPGSQGGVGGIGSAGTSGVSGTSKFPDQN
jgi:hypothetical protein